MSNSESIPAVRGHCSGPACRSAFTLKELLALLVAAGVVVGMQYHCRRREGYRARRREDSGSCRKGQELKTRSTGSATGGGHARFRRCFAWACRTDADRFALRRGLHSTARRSSQPGLDQAGHAVENDIPLRIFLVEDSPVLRDRLIESLTEPGVIEVSGHADTEKAALAALASSPWDVLILDLQLRQGSGLGVLKAIAPQRTTRSTVIILTNYAIAQYRTRAMQLGADYFFDKARDYGRLRDVLNDLARSRGQS